MQNEFKLLLIVAASMFKAWWSTSSQRRCLGSTYEPSLPWLMGLVGFLHFCTMRATAAVSLFADTLIDLHSATCGGRLSKSVLIFLGRDTS